MQYILSLLMLILALGGCECPKDKNYASSIDGRSVPPNGFLLTHNHLQHGHQNTSGQQYLTDCLFFGFDEHGLNVQNRALLKDHALWLQTKPGIKVLVSGHCDARGTREYNIGLGARRAYAIKRFLVAQGIDGYRIHVISKGKDAPLVKGSGDTIWAQNRAAVISEI